MPHLRDLLFPALIFVLLAVTSGSAARGGSTASQAESGAQDRSIRVTLTPAHISVPAGGDTLVIAVIDIEEGWKIWTNPREFPPNVATFEYAIHTDVEDASDDPHRLTAHAPFATWPAEYALSNVDVGDGPMPFPVFEGRVIVQVPVTIAPQAAPGEATVRLEVSYQPCSATECHFPTSDIVTATFTITDLGQASTPNPAASGLHDSFDASVFAAIRSGAAPPTFEGTRGTTLAAPVFRPTIFGREIPAAESLTGLIIVALLAALGGLLLNLTPCVLPVLPIKIMTLSKHAETPGRTLALGLWMAFGVVAFWLALGVPAAFISSMADPSRLFGIWWITLTIGLLIALMGVGIMGLFTMNLPGAVYAINPRADSAWGSFLFGVMTGVLGLPCFGFVAGALLAGSATLPWQNIMIIFGALGIGMAAPYMILSMKPGLVDRIPRTGPASDLVKQIMGLLLIAAAAYFVGSGVMTLVADRPWMGAQLHLWFITIIACLSGLWLIVRTWAITSGFPKRTVFSVIGMLLGGAALLFTLSSTEAGKRHYEFQLELASLAPDAYLTAGWIPFNEERLAAARHDGKVVVLEFTAVWCINCIMIKRTILDVNPVRTMLAAEDTVAITVDLSSRNASGWATHAAMGQTGIPLLIIFAGDDERPILLNAFTSEQVISGITEARQRLIAGRTERPAILASDVR